MAKRFGKLLGMDHWLIHPMFSQCGEVDFNETQGLECVRSHADALLTKVRRKYKEYGINEKPFVVIKADNGTGGMGHHDGARRPRDRHPVAPGPDPHGHHPGRP